MRNSRSWLVLATPMLALLPNASAEENEDSILLFEREARLAAKLRHSNIVGVIDFGTYDQTPYMRLELVDGTDLRALQDLRWTGQPVQDADHSPATRSAQDTGLRPHQVIDR